MMRSYLGRKNAAFHIACACAMISIVAGVLAMVLPGGVDGVSVSATSGILALVGAAAFVVAALVDLMAFRRRDREGAGGAGIDFVRIGIILMALLVFASFIVFASEVAGFLVSGFTDFAMDSSGGVFSIPGIVETGVCLVLLLVLAIFGNVLYWVPTRRRERYGPEKKAAAAGLAVRS